MNHVNYFTPILRLLLLLYVLPSFFRCSTSSWNSVSTAPITSASLFTMGSMTVVSGRSEVKSIRHSSHPCCIIEL